MKRLSASPLDFVAYAIAAVSLVAAVAVLGGFVTPPSTPPSMRYTFGSVLLLLGVYRIVITQTRRTQRAMAERFEAERAERERQHPSETL